MLNGRPTARKGNLIILIIRCYTSLALIQSFDETAAIWHNIDTEMADTSQAMISLTIC